MVNTLASHRKLFFSNSTFSNIKLQFHNLRFAVLHGDQIFLLRCRVNLLSADLEFWVSSKHFAVVYWPVYNSDCQSTVYNCGESLQNLSRWYIGQYKIQIRPRKLLEYITILQSLCQQESLFTL